MKVSLPKNRAHPYLACTPEELARLKKAYASKGAEHAAVAAVVERAARAIGKPPVFPPRGGQHNQWYQCDACQVALKTVDDTHHRCPLCKKVYSGYPYDDVIFSRRHHRNLRNATDAAWAWAITGKKKYARFTASVLLGYAERYSSYPLHDSLARTKPPMYKSAGRLFEQTLGEAACMTHFIAPSYDLIHDSGVLTKADHRKIRTGLFDPMLETLDKCKVGKGNWQSWHNAGMLWGGGVLGQKKWIDKAINDPKNGFLFQMTISVSDEGMWYENSWGYHFYALHALVALAEGARRMDIDLWSNNTFQKMFPLATHYVMADDSLPRFADDVNSRVTKAVAHLEPAHAATGDPQMATLLPGKVTWLSVLYGRDTSKRASRKGHVSSVFPSAGHAILRSKGRAGLTAAVTFGKHGGFHGHFDKLSFVLFGHRRELGVDPGRAASQAYRLPIHRNWYKATLSHNAVVIDGVSQGEAKGRLRLFSSGEKFSATLVECHQAYPGVKQQRLLVMTPEYMLVVDDLSSSKTHRFDWAYHNRGTKAETNKKLRRGKAWKGLVGGDYIKNIRTGSSDSTVRFRFPDGPVTTHLVMARRRGTKLLVGDGVGASVTDRVPMVLISRSGKKARFAAVLEPVKAGAKASVSDVRLTSRKGTLRVTVIRGDGRDIVEIDSKFRLKVKRDGKTVIKAAPAKAM
jgi:Heparinase II/III-like protein/Alginate lyase